MGVIMDSNKFIKMDLSNYDLSKIDSSSLLKVKTDDLLNQMKNVEYEHQKTMNIVAEQRRLKEEREEENRANLKATAESLERVNEKLEEQIQQKDEDLQNQREMIKMLKQQLLGINRTLSDLFIIYENDQDKQEEIRALAQDIYSHMVIGKKVDWKAIAIDKGIDMALASVPIILELAKAL